MKGMAPTAYFTAISIISSTLLFFYGFFPIMGPSNITKSSHDSLPKNITSHNSDLRSLNLQPEALYRKHVDKLVFIVIDGLRYDFVSKDNMKYTMDKVEENKCLVKVEVSAPTVTMPRLKSLMTGSISKYIDVILNFGATQISTDSLLHQLNQNKARTIFYGDDTWLKLFPPESFVRYEGTSSFYVSDYTEVDNNVTRNVLQEMKDPQSWDVMILHYLGLDHIGHVENSFSPLIHTKLQEMDSILELVHKGLIENEVKSGERYLLVVTGDHGMRDLGGHGGSTKPETLVPLATLGNDCTSGQTRDIHENAKSERRISMDAKVNTLNMKSEVTASQVDVTPTLAVLLGIPIPSCNTGKLIPQLLQNLTLSELLYAYYYNSKQITDSYFSGSQQDRESMQTLSEYYNLLLKTFPSELQVVNTINSFIEFLTDVSSHITKSSTHVDTYIVIAALVLSVLGTLLAILEPNMSFLNLPVLILTCCIVFVNSFSISSFPLNIFISYLLSIHVHSIYRAARLKTDHFVSRNKTRSSSKDGSFRLFFNIGGKYSSDSEQSSHQVADPLSDSKVNNLLTFLTGMTILCSLSTSYIENEHNVWMFVLNTFLFHILLYTKQQSKRGAVTALLVIHRLLRSINMKWLDEEASVSCTMSYWFQMNNPLYLSLFYSTSMISVYSVCLVIENNFCDMFFVSSKSHSVRTSHTGWNKVSSLIITVSMVSTFLYKTVPYYTQYMLLVTLACFVLYIALALFTLCTSSGASLKSLIVLSILLSLLLFKPYNAILISSLCVSSYLISKVLFTNNPFASIVLHMWLGRVYYFLQGSTNSIATIDITVGYIGQSEYNSNIAGVLIYFNLYALNFLSLFLLFSHLTSRYYLDVVRTHFKFISINLTFYLFIIYLQRNHLFIWSVFSPKLLLLSSYNLCNVIVLVLLFLF